MLNITKKSFLHYLQCFFFCRGSNIRTIRYVRHFSKLREEKTEVRMKKKKTQINNKFARDMKVARTPRRGTWNNENTHSTRCFIILFGFMKHFHDFSENRSCYIVK